MNNFKHYRNKKGLSQKEVGEYLGITGQAYSNYETFKRQADYETLLKLGELFEATVDELLKESPQKEKPRTDCEELSEYLEELRTRPEQRMLFSLTKDATKEDVEAAVRIIEAYLNKDK